MHLHSSSLLFLYLLLLIESLLCTKHIAMLSSHPSSELGAFSIPIFQIQNWGLDKLSNLPQVPQGESGRN